MADSIITGCCSFVYSHVLVESMLAFEVEWTERDLNPRPLGCKPSVHATELSALIELEESSIKFKGSQADTLNRFHCSNDELLIKEVSECWT